MIALYLLAAHLVGDFVLQTRWQAAGKFGWSFSAVALRLRHCYSYVIPFAFVAPFYGHGDGYLWFVLALFVLHFLTDAQRLPSTLGDVLAWHSENDRQTRRRPLFPPPNPWPSIGLALDQTLHVVQIALLAGVFLS